MSGADLRNTASPAAVMAGATDPGSDPTNPGSDSIAHDLLRGATAIGAYLGLTTRQVYHLTAASRLPHMRLGSVLCARRSTLRAWIADQEQRSIGGA